MVYPGGKEDYRKQVTLKLNSNNSDSGLFSSLGRLFSKPVQITKISLYDRDELIWESDF